MTSSGPDGATLRALPRGTGPLSRSAARLTENVAALHPASFALVMATGIVSVGCHIVGLRAVARTLVAVNAIFYPAMWTLVIVRVLYHRGRVIADLLHHGRSVGFFTAVAATCVLGSQLFIVADATPVAIGLWLVGIALWATLTYGVFGLLTIRSEKPSLADGMHGGWLVAVVATQSVCILGAQVAQRTVYRDAIAPACLALWLAGGMLYVFIACLNFYRHAFFSLKPNELMPTYWINMGAAAISTLAGARLLELAAWSPALTPVLPFVRGFTFMWWATATWWIPLCLFLGAWRHFYRKVSLAYDPLYWSIVFPLGMYGVCTSQVTRAIDAPFLPAISRFFVYVALAAWSVVTAGLVRRLLSSLRTK